VTAENGHSPLPLVPRPASWQPSRDHCSSSRARTVWKILNAGTTWSTTSIASTCSSRSGAAIQSAFGRGRVNEPRRDRHCTAAARCSHARPPAIQVPHCSALWCGINLNISGDECATCVLITPALVFFFFFFVPDFFFLHAEPSDGQQPSRVDPAPMTHQPHLGPMGHLPSPNVLPRPAPLAACAWSPVPAGC